MLLAGETLDDTESDGEPTWLLGDMTCFDRCFPSSVTKTSNSASLLMVSTGSAPPTAVWVWFARLFIVYQGLKGEDGSHMSVANCFTKRAFFGSQIS